MSRRTETKNGGIRKQWCCFEDCVIPQQDKNDKRFGKYPPYMGSRMKTEKVSLSKKRPFTCNLDTQHKLNTTPREKHPQKRQPMVNPFCMNQFYTPQLKNQSSGHPFSSKYESPQPKYKDLSYTIKTQKNNIANFSNTKFDESFNVNLKNEDLRKIEQYPINSNLQNNGKINIVHIRRINFIYKSNKVIQPECIPSQEFKQLEETIKETKKHKLHIQKTVDVEYMKQNNPSSQYGKANEQRSSFSSFRLNKQPSKPITLNYSSFQDQKSVELQNSELSINIRNDAGGGSGSQKNNNKQSMQMTNLPTQRCLNSVNDSVYYQNTIKLFETKNASEKSIEKGTQRLDDSDNIAYSVNGSQGSSGKQSVIVDLTIQEPLSPHIMKIKSQRQSKASSKNSKVFCLSEIKL